MYAVCHSFQLAKQRTPFLVFSSLGYYYFYYLNQFLFYGLRDIIQILWNCVLLKFSLVYVPFPSTFRIYRDNSNTNIMEKLGHLFQNFGRQEISQTMATERVSFGCNSALWKLKEELDESFQEQNIVSDSIQSGAVSLQVPSFSSDQNTTSIMQKGSHHTSPHTSAKTFLDVLRQKISQNKIKVKPRKHTERKLLNKSLTVNMKKLSQWRSISQRKQKMTNLRQQRSKILNEINGQLQAEKLWMNTTQKEMKICTCCQGIKQTLSIPQRKTHTITPSHYEYFSPESQNKRQSIVRKADSIIIDDNPQPSKMMKNIVNMKNQLKRSRNQNGKDEQQMRDRIIEWYHLPQRLLTNKVESTNIEPVKARRRTSSLCNDSDCSSNKELTRVIQCLLTGQFLQSESRSDLSFTFGQLQKSNVKAKLELIKRHMKKVSIDLQEKENYNQWEQYKTHA